MNARIDRDENLPDPAFSKDVGQVGGMDPEVLSVVEEQARVSVERRELGGVRVRVVTDSSDVVHPVTLGSEQVEVTRHPVGREIETMPDTRQDGDTTIIPVVEERAVVVTRLFLVEEIHVRRTATTETVEVPVTLRRQRAVVELLEPEAGSSVPVEGQAANPDRDL